MQERQKRWIAPVGILILLLGFAGLADSGEVTLKCLPEGLSLTGSKAEDRSAANGYSVPRRQVLVEITTATWWGGCSCAAVAADSLKKLKGDSLTVLSYHASDSFQCPDGFPRMYYYFGDTIWLPTAVFDGKDPQIGGGEQAFSIYQTRYHEHMQINTPGVLSVKAEYDSSTRDGVIIATFTSVDQISQADLHFRYAIAESHIYHEWQYLDSLQFVVRDMLPDHIGVPFSINQGATVVDTQSFHIDTAWVAGNCELVAFVQSDQDTTVLISISAPLVRAHVSGDANGDGVVTISDAGFLSSYLLFGTPVPEPLASGDPNEDCQIDIEDIVYLLNYLFHQGPVPLRGC